MPTRHAKLSMVSDRTPLAAWSVSDGKLVVRGRGSIGRVVVHAGLGNAGRVLGYIELERLSAPGEVTLAFGVAEGLMRREHAATALRLLVHRLAVTGKCSTVRAVLERGDRESRAAVTDAGFGILEAGRDGGEFGRVIPPLHYTDGLVTIRRQDPADIDADLEAKDEEQIRWLWLPGDRERWEAKTPGEQREHAERGLRENRDAFGRGPKWTFAVDTEERRYVACVDCDLANPNAPAGEANIAYACHPAHRGRGYVSRGVRLVLRFLAEHTGSRRAHLVVDAENVASLRVARSVAGEAEEEFVDAYGRRALRFVVRV